VAAERGTQLASQLLRDAWFIPLTGDRCRKGYEASELARAHARHSPHGFRWRWRRICCDAHGLAVALKMQRMVFLSTGETRGRAPSGLALSRPRRHRGRVLEPHGRSAPLSRPMYELVELGLVSPSSSLGRSEARRERRQGGGSHSVGLAYKEAPRHLRPTNLTARLLDLAGNSLTPSRAISRFFVSAASCPLPESA
jgi:hypothetical protein